MLIAMIFIICSALFISDYLDIDPDNDKLNSTYEKEIGTNPYNSDTDGDGLNDGKEVEIGTDPNNPDTDNDGLYDSEELQIGTNPFLRDTDDDGLIDSKDSHPTTHELKLKDIDGDGLNDYQEIIETNTDPNAVDTDNDFISDGEEINKYGTDPTKKDTDDDKILDFDEIFSYQTNPTRPDSEKIFDNLPNVNVRLWNYSDGINTRSKYISQNDPVVQWYAKHVKLVDCPDILIWQITWLVNTPIFNDTRPAHAKKLILTTDGSKLFFPHDGIYTRKNPHDCTYTPKGKEQIKKALNTTFNPSYQLTHGRIGVCGDNSFTAASILEAQGHPSIVIRWYDYNGSHAWAETEINGEIYVIDPGIGCQVVPRDILFYARPYDLEKAEMIGKDFGWKKYDSKWYEK